MRRFEPLREQMPLDAPQGRLVDCPAPAETLLQRLHEQGALIDVGEHLGDRSLGDVSRDAKRFELAEHPQPAAPLGVCFSRAHARAVRRSSSAPSRRSRTTAASMSSGSILPAFETEAICVSHSSRRASMRKPVTYASAIVLIHYFKAHDPPHTDHLALSSGRALKADGPEPGSLTVGPRQ